MIYITLDNDFIDEYFHDRSCKNVHLSDFIQEILSKVQMNPNVLYF